MFGIKNKQAQGYSAHPVTAQQASPSPSLSPQAVAQYTHPRTDAPQPTNFPIQIRPYSLGNFAEPCRGAVLVDDLERLDLCPGGAFALGELLEHD